MIVLHLITTLDPGGAEHHLLDLSRRQKAAGWDVHVAFLKGEGRLAPAFEGAGIAVSKIALEGWAHLPGAVLRVLGRIRALRPDIVHTHLLKADGLGALTCRLSPSTALVSSKHNDEDWLRGALWSFLHARLMRRADKVIGISDWVCRFMAEKGGVPAPKLRRVYYGLDPIPYELAGRREAVRAEWGVQPQDTLIGCVARIAPQKDPETLLRAFAELSRKRPGLRLVWAGLAHDPAFETTVRALGKELGLEGRLTWAGFRTDLPNVLSALDLFVLPSRWEGFGLVLLEAMAAGLPVLATKVSAIPEIVQDGVTGRLVAPGDPAALAAAMKELLDDEPLRRRLGTAGRERVEKDFSPAKAAEEVLKVYGEAIAERRG